MKYLRWFILASGINPLFAWEGKVFQVSGKKITVASSNTAAVRAGMKIYILKNGKEVGQGQITQVYHTKVEVTMLSGIAGKSLIATDNKPSAQLVAVAAPAPITKLEKPVDAEADAALFKAVEANDIEAVESALNNGANPNAVNEGGSTPIFYVVNSDQPNIVRLLIAHGADVNYATPGDNAFTPLRGACIRGNIESINILLDGGANPNLQIGAMRASVLFDAILSQRVEVVRLLLSRSANPNLKRWDGKSPLAYAIEKKNETIIEMLKAVGARQ